jgi:hypothetical protein
LVLLEQTFQWHGILKIAFNLLYVRSNLAFDCMKKFRISLEEKINEASTRTIMKKSMKHFPKEISYNTCHHALSSEKKVLLNLSILFVKKEVW